MLKQIKKILYFKIGPTINYSKINPLKFNWGKIKDFFKTGIIIFLFVFLILLTVSLIKSDFIDDDEKIASEISNQIIDYLDENYIFPNDDENENCNISDIKLYGALLTYMSNEDMDENGYPIYDQSYSENIIAKINSANKDGSIKAILIEVNSFGGSPAAAEEINDAVKHSEKPVIAYIRESGVSAAYWSISGASHIIALPSSDVGGIGVTMSYLDNTQKNKKEGLTFNQLSTGKFKDTLSPDKVLTHEERQLIMRDLDIVNNDFMEAVSKNRGIDFEIIRKMADGSSMMGNMSLENKLVDQIGTIYDTKVYLKKLIGEDVEICS